jgi:hypothetical protein
MHDFLLATADVIGMIGVATILVAYLLLSVDRWVANSLRYHFLNFLGAWMILYSLYFHWNLSAVVIEISWIIISMVGMIRVFRMKKS